MRVTNWAYGVQIECVHAPGPGARLVPIPNYPRTTELIGDALFAGQYATMEGISSYTWGLNTYQWLKIHDTSGRALEIYGDGPEIPDWDSGAHPAADITVINIGTNDNNTANNVTHQEFRDSYIQLIDEVHARWPASKIIVLALGGRFLKSDNTWVQGGGFVDIIQDVVRSYNNGLLNERGGEGFVHYFNTTGTLEHNDIGPLYHPTDVGHIKLASRLMQYIKLTFVSVLEQTGPEGTA